MAKKAPRERAGRAKRRQLERVVRKSEATVDRVLGMLPGGAPENPIDVESASVIDTRAVRDPCPKCAGDSELVEHLATIVEQRRLREARVRCRQCGKERSVWFALPLSITH